MKSRYFLSIGLLFLAAGTLVGFEPIQRYLKQDTQKTIVSAQSIPVSAAKIDTTAPLIEGKPSRIQIPALDIDLPVIDGAYDPSSKTWTLTKDKAQFGLITPLANNRQGNTFIYGHARKEVFASLPKIKSGDVVIVNTDNGHQFSYIFRSMYETNPYDDAVFHYAGAPILTLQTCTGLWSQNRSLYTFDLVKVV